MAFTVKKKLDLAYLGEGWGNNTFVSFNSMTFAETREFSKIAATVPDAGEAANTESLDTVINLLKSHFIDGMGYNGEAIVPITVDDLESLPTDVITKSIELLAGNADPKS